MTINSHRFFNFDEENINNRSTFSYNWSNHEKRMSSFLERNFKWCLILFIATFLTLFILVLFNARHETITNIRSVEAKTEGYHDLCNLMKSMDGGLTPSTTSIKLVKTTAGIVEGYETSLFGQRLSVFLGVPYAAPPIGDLRFKPSIPVEPWSGVRETVRYAAHCSQYLWPVLLEHSIPVHYKRSEDCLYLNIWSPRGPVRESILKTYEDISNKIRPVVVWIHGGGFNMGSPAILETEGDVLAVYGDVVVVTINIRVGALGFLNLNIDDAPGNQQIYDIRTSLKWIKNNILSFGGDPDQVTIVAQSSGAMDVALMVLNPANERLYNRVILQSGGYTFYEQFYDQNDAAVNKFISLVGCDDQSSPQQTLKCLKAIDVDLMVKAQEQMASERATSFTPNTDDPGIFNLAPKDLMVATASPEMMANITSNNYFKAPFSSIDSILMGTNKDEASLLLNFVMPEVFTKEGVKLNFTKLSQMKIWLIDTVDKFLDLPKSQIITLVNTFFREEDSPNDTTASLIKRLYDFAGDISFLCPLKSLAEDILNINSYNSDHFKKMNIKSKDVFMYRFSYRPEWDQKSLWMGVHHNREIPYVFGYPFKRPLEFNGQDMEMSRMIMKIWTDFAKSATVRNSVPNVTWPNYSFENQDYLDLSGPNVAQPGTKLHSKSCELYRLGAEILGR